MVSRRTPVPAGLSQRSNPWRWLNGTDRPSTHDAAHHGPLVKLQGGAREDGGTAEDCLALEAMTVGLQPQLEVVFDHVRSSCGGRWSSRQEDGQECYDNKE